MTKALFCRSVQLTLVQDSINLKLFKMNKFEKLGKFGIQNSESVSVFGGENKTATVCEDYTYNSSNQCTDGHVTTSDDKGNIIGSRSVTYPVN